MSKTVAVLGLDGMPLSLLEEAMERSWMPFLKSVRHKLAWKQLDPIIPLTHPTCSS
jgi:predicted AlkP superfamily phosphohydrolase/phosphomutase